jgi:predicted hydrocarbon binding protein
MSGSFKERLSFDAGSGALFDQSRRYMMIRPDALMGIFKRLPPDQRIAALQAFAESIAEQGGDSARAYVSMGGTGAKLLDVIAATAPELGWGIWQFWIEDGRFTLSVRNSPFAAGFGPSDHPVCTPIIGMFGAVTSIVAGKPMLAREIHCAAMGAELCQFESTPRTSTP